MNKSPFSYGVTVSNRSFTNRETEVQRLKQNFKDGINTIIISPRRWGKSSLVEKVAATFENNKKIRVVVIDLFTVSSEEAFLELYAKEIVKASSGKWEEWVNTARSIFKSIVPRISFSIDPQNDFSLGFDWKEATKFKQEILDLPQRIAEEKKLQIVICIDEFQRIAEFKNSSDIEKRFRSSWQRQKDVSFCLYGSKRHMMTDIFTNSNKPFYRFGDVMLLQKIKREKWQSFIVNGFATEKKEIDLKDAAYIADMMQNHPWYVQQLSHISLNQTSKKAGKKEIKQAIQLMIQSNSPLYEREIEFISTTQLNLLKAILKGESKLTSKRVMDDFSLGTPNNVSKNKASLKENDVIDENNGKIELLDPVFELWFRQRFFGQAMR